VDVGGAGGAGTPNLEPLHLEPLHLEPLPWPGGAGETPHPSIAAGGGTHGDSVGSLLQLLSTPQIRDLLSSGDAHRSSHGGAVSDGHLQAAGAAVANRDVPGALAHLTEYIKVSPEHAAGLRATPSLIPIQGEVDQLLRHATHEAKNEAERLFATATLAVGAAGAYPRELNGPDVLAIAERLAESGQLVNYVRAAELSQAVITSYFEDIPVALPGAARRDLALHRTVPELMRMLWRKVPLFVLLAGWLALGVVGFALLSRSAMQLGFEVWGLGFLALVGLQFYISVRNARF